MVSVGGKILKMVLDLKGGPVAFYWPGRPTVKVLLVKLFLVSTLYMQPAILPLSTLVPCIQQVSPYLELIS